MFAIRITEPASIDVDNAFLWWAENRSLEQATRWYEQAQLAILSLKRMPERCPFVSDIELSLSGVRQLHFGLGKRPTHRIVFVIENDVVVILRVRHHGQDDLAG